jgi:molybdopterin converting factor small subunit
MPVTVSIPTIMRGLTGGEKRVQAEGATLSALIDDLEANHPGLAERLLKDGKLNRYVNIYVDDEDVRFAGVPRPRCRGTPASRSCPPWPGADPSRGALRIADRDPRQHPAGRPAHTVSPMGR